MLFVQLEPLQTSNVIDVGNVTSYNLAGLVSQLDSAIAVTAYDYDADGIDDQVEGHESWFSMPGEDFGCTDAAACNYDEAADTNDGSCLYNDECVYVWP